jgi:uncharacterized protein with HEPN domain
MEHHFMDKKIKSKIKKLIQDSFKHNYNQIPWNGMHDGVVNEIESLIDKKDIKKLKNNENKA